MKIRNGLSTLSNLMDQLILDIRALYPGMEKEGDRQTILCQTLSEAYNLDNCEGDYPRWLAQVVYGEIMDMQAAERWRKRNEEMQEKEDDLDIEYPEHPYELLDI